MLPPVISTLRQRAPFTGVHTTLSSDASMLTVVPGSALPSALAVRGTVRTTTSEPGSTFDDVDPSTQGIADDTDDAPQGAKGAPDATGHDDPTVGAYEAGCVVTDEGTGEWVIEPCPES